MSLTLHNALRSPFRMARARNENRSDETNQRQLLTWNNSENYTPSSEEVSPCLDPEQNTPPQTLSRRNAGQPCPRLIGLPRSTTFKRQTEEQRTKLRPFEPTIKERRNVSRDCLEASRTVPPPPRQGRRQDCLEASRTAPPPPRQGSRERSVPLDPPDAYPSVAQRIGPITITQFSQKSAERVSLIESCQKMKKMGNNDVGKRSHHLQHCADTGTQSHMKPSMYHTARSFGTKSQQSCSIEPIRGDLESEPEMLLQPDTRPILHEDLVVEVKGIYAGLVMVEAKCIDIDERQSDAAPEKNTAQRANLTNDQWQSLVALHKQLLHEHHDFFLASQHPSASPALNRLAAKYSMPARMWRHGIHAFLEVLRHKLPEQLEHMLALIYIAYCMMALLYETVSAFEDTWIECLGDLGRYRMDIEDDEPKDREVWSNVARFWYNKTADKNSNVGRLYHHLAILARPYRFEQLSLYTRSLTCVSPFASAKGSIMTLFNPILQDQSYVHYQLSLPDTLLIRAHAILSNGQSLDSFDPFLTTVTDLEVNKPFRNIVKNTTKLVHGLSEPAPELYGSLPEDFMVRGLLYAQTWFPEDWFQPTASGHNPWWSDLCSMAQKGIAKMPCLGVQISTALQRNLYADYYSETKQYVVLVTNSLKRRSLLLNSSLLVPLITSCLPAVRASPIGNPDDADEPLNIASLVPLIAGSLYVGFAVAALATAHSLATKKGRIRVWGSMMGISAYSWWAIKNDATASPSLSITILGVWAISAFHYGNASFQEFRIPEGVLLVILLGAFILDMVIVSFMTPKGAPISQPDLLSLSLPVMSMSLAITANLFGCFRNQPPSPPPSHETEVGKFPYNEGFFQQRTAVPDLATSRLRLLGSPLHEDSTRIWENDD